MTLTLETPLQDAADFSLLPDGQHRASSPTLNVDKEVAVMRRLSVDDLRTRYTEVFGEQTKVRNKQWLLRRIVWRLQALAEGDLSERARRRAAELADESDLRRTPPRSTAPVNRPAPSSGGRLPMPGQEIVRPYKGQTLVVRVLKNGFEFEGDVYKSLSAVAKKITGTHCNGYLFFRLNRPGGAK